LRQNHNNPNATHKRLHTVCYYRLFAYLSVGTSNTTALIISVENEQGIGLQQARPSLFYIDSSQQSSSFLVHITCTEYKGVAYCYRCSMVAVRLSCVTRSGIKMAEPIQMPYQLWTRVGPGNHVLGMGPNPHGNGVYSAFFVTIRAGTAYRKI